MELPKPFSCPGTLVAPRGDLRQGRLMRLRLRGECPRRAERADEDRAVPPLRTANWIVRFSTNGTSRSHEEQMTRRSESMHARDGSQGPAGHGRVSECPVAHSVEAGPSLCVAAASPHTLSTLREQSAATGALRADGRRVAASLGPGRRVGNKTQWTRIRCSSMPPTLRRLGWWHFAAAA